MVVQRVYQEEDKREDKGCNSEQKDECLVQGVVDEEPEVNLVNKSVHRSEKIPCKSITYKRSP